MVVELRGDLKALLYNVGRALVCAYLGEVSLRVEYAIVKGWVCEDCDSPCFSELVSEHPTENGGIFLAMLRRGERVPFGGGGRGR